MKVMPLQETYTLCFTVSQAIKTIWQTRELVGRKSI